MLGVWCLNCKELFVCLWLRRDLQDGALCDTAEWWTGQGTEMWGRRRRRLAGIVARADNNECKILVAHRVGKT